MSTKGEEGKQGKSETSANAGKEASETSDNVIIRNTAHEENESVKLADILNRRESGNSPQLPERPMPRRKYFLFSPVLSGSKRSEDGSIKSGAQNVSDKEYITKCMNSQKPRDSSLDVENSTWESDTVPCDQLVFVNLDEFGSQEPLPGRQAEGKTQDGNRARHSVPSDAGYFTEQDRQQKSLHKDKYVDSSIWHRLLHPEQRNVKRCRPCENRFDASKGNARCENHQNCLQAAENRKLLAIEEGIVPLRISEDHPVRAEMVDEEFNNVELRPKKRLDSFCTGCLKETERQLEIIEQGQLANLHLDPADEDPALAAVIPRPNFYDVDGSENERAAFHRGEPGRRSAGGVIETSGNSRSRPHARTGNAGSLSPDVTTPSLLGFGRTSVTRKFKSPTEDKDEVSHKVCIAD
jgi:hypothetical protein